MQTCSCNFFCNKAIGIHGTPIVRARCADGCIKVVTARYNKKAYDRINIIVKKGQRQIIKDYAASQGKSLNRFVCDLIEAEMNTNAKTE